LGAKLTFYGIDFASIQTSKIWFKSRLMIETHVWGLKTPNQTYTKRSKKHSTKKKRGAKIKGKKKANFIRTVL
jgi:hypothetical protein